MYLELIRVQGRRHLLWVPGFKRKLLCVENKFAVLLYVFVSDDRLDCRIRVVDQQLINCLERDLGLLLIAVQSHDLFFGVINFLAFRVFTFGFFIFGSRLSLVVEFFEIFLHEPLHRQAACIASVFWLLLENIHSLVSYLGKQWLFFKHGCLRVSLACNEGLDLFLSIFIITSMSAKIDLLVSRHESDVLVLLVVLLDLVVGVVLLHVFEDFLGHSQWVDPLRLLEVLKVRDEVALLGLQICILIRVDATTGEIGVERGMARNLALVDLFGPEGMFAQMFPGDALDWVFLEQSAQEVIENDRKALDVLQLGVLNLRYQLVQPLSRKRRAPCSHLVEDTAKCPAVGLE